MRRGRAMLAVLAAGGLTVLSLPPARALVTEPGSTIDGVQGEPGDRRIEFVGVLVDQPDLRAAGIGTAGAWFPQFDAPKRVTGARTGNGAVDHLPPWVTALNHATNPENGPFPPDPGCTEPGALARGCLPTYAFRTFSGDGPAQSAGGITTWSRLRLPTGECGISGAIVDPQTWDGSPNNNNTVNRIQLQDGVRPEFYVSVVTDNTDGDHDVDRLVVRGNVGLWDVPDDRSQVEPVSKPENLRFNGVPDVYVFRVSNFESGDYLKLGLAGRDGSGSFGGLLFDEHLDVPAPHLRGSVTQPGQRRGAPVTVDCTGA